MSVARDLYLRCVEEDPQYAPACARLGRCHRLIAKWSGEPEVDLARAEVALKRALKLNPDLPVAHHLYAQLESEVGRAQEVMKRLLRRAAVKSNDPELFAGLTHSCRYCGCSKPRSQLTSRHVASMRRSEPVWHIALHAGRLFERAHQQFGW
jgi:hypothetical protein